MGQALREGGWRPIRNAEHQHRPGEVGVPVERINHSNEQ